MGLGRSGAGCGHVSATDREATQDYSRAFSPDPAGRRRLVGLRALLLLSGLFGALLLIAADLSTLYEVRVVTVIKASISGHAQHSYALALVGLAGLPMAFAALRGRPASAALAVLGLVAAAALVIAGDLHDVHSTGVIGQLYENASARPGPGFYYETLGAALLVLTGLGGLLRAPPTAGRPARVRAGGAGPPPPASAPAGDGQ
jgi:hypothetical protein